MEKLRASKLEIREVSKQDEIFFLNKYHYQGFANSSWCKGLYINDELIELMSFGKPRYNRNAEWELIRLCTKENIIVYGGASKLFKEFCKDEPYGSIISYCNKDKFSGKVYEALGFTYEAISKGYHYEKDGISYNRMQFQKHKLPDIFGKPEYKDLTEYEIMSLEGYTKVDDLYGQARYIYSRMNDPTERWYIYEIESDGWHYVGQHKYHTGDDIENDNYYGSGKIAKRLPHPHKKIIVDGIETQKLANDLEECGIKLNRQIYGFVNDGGRNINIRISGQGTFGASYATKGKKSMIDTNGKKHYVSEDKVAFYESQGWKLGAYHIIMKQESIERMRQTKLSQHNHPVAWNKGKTDIFTDEQLEKISQGSKNKSKNEKEELKKVGLIAVTDKAKELGISRAMVLKRFDCFDYYVGKQKYKVCKIDEISHFIDNRGKSKSEAKKKACRENGKKGGHHKK